MGRHVQGVRVSQQTTQALGDGLPVCFRNADIDFHDVPFFKTI
jgi:hypothetical protein